MTGPGRAKLTQLGPKAAPPPSQLLANVGSQEIMDEIRLKVTQEIRNLTSSQHPGEATEVYSSN